MAGAEGFDFSAEKPFAVLTAHCAVIHYCSVRIHRIKNGSTRKKYFRFWQGQKDSTFLRKSGAGSDSTLCCLHFRPVRTLYSKPEKDPHTRWRSFSGRGRRIRTLNKGFGDPRVTITPCPCVHNSAIIGERKGIVKLFRIGSDHTS